MKKFIYWVMLEAADMQYVVDAAKIIDLENGGIVMNLFFFSSFSFVAVAWLFSRYYLIIKTTDYKSLMLEFDGVETLESTIRVCTGYEIVSVCSCLAHFRTWVSNESM